MYEAIIISVTVAIISGVFGLLANYLTARIVAKTAAASAAAGNEENGRQIEEIKISIDGRMEALLDTSKKMAAAAATLAEKEAQLEREEKAADTVKQTSESAAQVVQQTAESAAAVLKEAAVVAAERRADPTP